MRVAFNTTPIGRQLLFPSLFGPRLRVARRLSKIVLRWCHPYTGQHHQRMFAAPQCRGLPISKVMEVWGFEPQTYGLQSHRSSHLSYTPHACPDRLARTLSCKRGPRRLPTPRGAHGTISRTRNERREERAVGHDQVSRVTLDSGCGCP